MKTAAKEKLEIVLSAPVRGENQAGPLQDKARSSCLTESRRHVATMFSTAAKIEKCNFPKELTLREIYGRPTAIRLSLDP
jgi:hypothetical protein